MNGNHRIQLSFFNFTVFPLILNDMIRLNIPFLIFSFFYISTLFGYDGTSPENRYEHSKIIDIPDLSFVGKVYSGLDILEQMDFKPLRNKSIAILTNQSAVNRNNQHLLDILTRYPDIKVSYLLSMEHGIWSTNDKRSKMVGRDGLSPLHKAQIIDLFKTYLYPPSWVMDNIDLVLVDYQDTGSRYTTYTATLSKVFESASDFEVPIFIVDRPNPIRGDLISGPIPRLEFQSFESYHLFPIRHGLTIGEMALIINEMGWVKDLKRIQLNIIPMANWEREMWFEDTQLPWKNLTPYLESPLSLLAYSGMDLFRGTNLNIGFGTGAPYMIFGSPWLSTSYLLRKLKEQNLPGVAFKEIEYRPIGSTYYKRAPKFDNLKCSGLELIITDQNNFKPIETATSVLILMDQLFPRQFQWEKNNYIDKLFGSNELRILAAQKKNPDHLPALWSRDVYKFNEFRQPFLIYK